MKKSIFCNESWDAIQKTTTLSLPCPIPGSTSQPHNLPFLLCRHTTSVCSAERTTAVRGSQHTAWSSCSPQCIAWCSCNLFQTTLHMYWECGGREWGGRLGDRDRWKSWGSPRDSPRNPSPSRWCRKDPPSCLLSSFTMNIILPEFLSSCICYNFKMKIGVFFLYLENAELFTPDATRPLF